MGSTLTTVVLELSDELVEILTQQARDGDMTLDELLIGHACATALNTLAANGDMPAWRKLMRLWRERCPGQAPGWDMEELPT